MAPAEIAAEMAIQRAKWDDLVQTAIAQRPIGLGFAAPYYLQLWRDFLSAGLASSHFVTELTKPGEDAFFKRVWGIW